MNNTLCSRSWTDVNIDFFNGSVRHCCKSQEEKLPKNLTIDFIPPTSLKLEYINMGPIDSFIF